MYKKTLNYILSKSSLFFNLDTKYFAKTGFYGGIQQVIGISCGLIISYFFGHFASKKLFGDYNLILSVVSFLTIVTLPGLDNYLIRSIAQHFDSSYFRSIKIKFFFSLLGIPVLLYFSGQYFSQKDVPLGIAFLLTLLLFPLLAPSQLFNEFYTGKLKFKILTIFTSISSILSLVLLSSAIFFTHNLLLVLFAYLISILIPAILASLYTTKFIDKVNKVDRDLIRMGIFNTALSVIPWSAAYLSQIILGTRLGTETLAVFIVANKIPVYIQKNLFVFYKPLTAKLAQQSNRLQLITFRRHWLKLLLWGILLALPTYFLSPLVIQFIFTNKYSEAIPFAQLLSLSVIPLPISWVLADIIVFQKIKKPRVISSLIIDSLKIVFYLILIPTFKIKGLIAVYIVERYISTIVNYYLVYFYGPGQKSKKIILE